MEIRCISYDWHIKFHWSKNVGLTRRTPGLLFWDFDGTSNGNIVDIQIEQFKIL